MSTFYTGRAAPSGAALLSHVRGGRGDQGRRRRRDGLIGVHLSTSSALAGTRSKPSFPRSLPAMASRTWWPKSSKRRASRLRLRRPGPTAGSMSSQGRCQQDRTPGVAQPVLPRPGVGRRQPARRRASQLRQAQRGTARRPATETSLVAGRRVTARRGLAIRGRESAAHRLS